MNSNTKSTPISHLPQQALPPAQEVISGDDDTTIQEVLNQIAASSSQPQQQPPAPPPVPQQNVTPQQAAFMAAHNSQQLSNIDTNVLLSMINNVPVVTAGPNTSMMNMMMNMLTQDFKLAAIVFVVFVAVSFIPITQILGKYFSLDRIPHSDVIIRGALVAIAVMLLMKTLLK